MKGVGGGNMYYYTMAISCPWSPAMCDKESEGTRNNTDKHIKALTPLTSVVVGSEQGVE